MRDRLILGVLIVFVLATVFRAQPQRDALIIIQDTEPTTELALGLIWQHSNGTQKVLSSMNPSSWITVSAGGGGGGGAPTNATYLTQTADATLTNEQALGILATGLVKNTTSTGVQSIYAGASCTNQLIEDLDGSGVPTCVSVGTSYVSDDAITYAKLQNVSATSRFLGRITAGVGDTEELTGTQATTLLDNFTSALKGLVPASGGGTTNFLRADGTWAAPSGGGGGLGYTINVQALTSSPADGATVFFGLLPKAPVTTGGNSKVHIRTAGTITAANIYTFSGTAGTNEAWSLYVRKNNTTDTLIQTVSLATSERVFSNSSLSISVVAGDYIEIKGIQPTWATNPLTTIYGGYIYVQ